MRHRRHRRRSTLQVLFVLGVLVECRSVPLATPGPGEASPRLPGTRTLKLEGDIASVLVSGVDRFLLAETELAVTRRKTYWKRDVSSPAAYDLSVEPNRRRLRRILGLRDPRVSYAAPELVATTERSSLVARGPRCDIHAIRWPVLDGIHGEGLLLEPAGGKPAAQVVVVPDADGTPEELVGLAGTTSWANPVALRLAEAGCRVVVPALVNRGTYLWDREPTWRSTGLTHREFVYRAAFELGRHVIGYELQKILAVVDWFARREEGERPPIGVFGWGEGGLLSLYAAAVDPRIVAVCVSGYFGSREGLWQEPIDRNVFGLLEEFGDAEVASLIAPRALVVEAARGPEFRVPPGGRGAPGRLRTFPIEDIRGEIERARTLASRVAPPGWPSLAVSGGGSGPPGTGLALDHFSRALLVELPLPERERPPAIEPLASPRDPDARLLRQVREMDRFNQRLLLDSPGVREEFFKGLDTSSLEAFLASVERYRTIFRDEVIGRFDRDLRPPEPRSRLFLDGEAWTGYEIVLDVFEDVIAYGILLVPKGIPDGERRPVVVCQHGLEGRPEHVIHGDHRAYHDFGARLAEEGFVVLAPQNLYIFGDRFRTLQRKANPLGKTLFSIIVPQHRQLVRWLGTLPFVDRRRIGFYGLSYGGKTAMRVPALVDEYSVVICSADFNDWIWKNASTRSRYSYVWTGEYEIFEFDLGSTFNYAEMAALIAPRPFMVERGHFDGVAPDARVAFEFAKVRFLYEARLGLSDRAEIEFFVGPHTIHGEGTFSFLRHHLDWPPAAER